MSSLRRGQAIAATIGGGAFAVAASVASTLVAIRITGESGFDSFGVVATGIATTSLVLLGTALFVARKATGSVRETLGLNSASWVAFVAAPIGVVALGPVSDLLARWMAQLAPELTFGGLEGLRRLARNYPPWLLLPVVALLPGLGEELFFRGMLQRAFGRGVIAVIVSTLAFSLFHLDPHHVAGVLPLGLYLAWVAARTSSTWVTVVAHVLNNTAAIIAPRFAALDAGYGTGHPVPVWWAGVGLGVAVATLGAIGRVSPADKG